MKRSDMLDKIEDLLLNMLAEGYFIAPKDFWQVKREDAIWANTIFGDAEERILSFFEEQGMIPPYSGSDPYYSARIGALNDCKWEPEDE